MSCNLRARNALVCSAPLVAVVSLLALRWHDGWLFLLDWAPGPRSSAWPPFVPPLGPVTYWVIGSVTVFCSQSAGWLPIVAALVAAFVGAVRLATTWQLSATRHVSTLAGAMAGIVAVASPFVIVRSYSGQVGVLFGYAALWWLLASVTRSLQAVGTRSWVRPGVWFAVAAMCSVHMVFIAAVPLVFAFIPISRRSGRNVAFRNTFCSLSLGAALTALWLIPVLYMHGNLLGSAGEGSAVSTFTSAGSMWWLWASSATGAAFWRPLPALMLAWPVALVVLAWVGSLFVARWGAGWSRDLRSVLVGCAAFAVAAGAVGRGPTAGVWASLVESFLPAALMREPAKWLMLAVPFPAVAAAALVERISTKNRAVAASLVVLATAAALLAWNSATAQLKPVSYPAEWLEARAAADADQCTIAVLGDGAYTDPGFTNGRVVAAPAAGFLGRRAAVSRDPLLRGLKPKPPRTAQESWVAGVNEWFLKNPSKLGDLSHAALVPEAAAEAGIGWVFIDRPVDRPALVADLRAGGFEPVVTSARAGLWRNPIPCQVQR